MKIVFGLAALACLALSPSLAKADPARHYKAGQPVALGNGHAYILLRSLYPRGRANNYEVAFIRELSAGEAALAGSGQTENVFATDEDKPYERLAGERVYLLAVQPGSYVIAGAGISSLKSVVGTCMCMGTVRFEAKPGVITDLGYVLAAREGQPTTIPELAGHVNAGVNYGSVPVFAMTVRPFRTGMHVPAALASQPRVPAEYRPVGSFPNPFRMMINRMAPVPGVLSYDEDRLAGPGGR